MQAVTDVEREFFRVLNPLVEPWARAGFVSPTRWPFGLIVLETSGRRSGRPRSVPVLAMIVDQHVVVATARGERSDWFRNLEADPHPRYWLDGEPREGFALTFAPGRPQPPVEELPPAVQDAICALEQAVVAGGCRFAVLCPRPSA